jgi:hypothetical protein
MVPTALIPDIAAKIVQIITTPIANPPLMDPSHLYMVSKRSSAMPEPSRRYAINTKSGMEINT